MDDRVSDQEKPLAGETHGAAGGLPRHPFAPPHAPRWFGVALRLFILVLVAGLIAFVANECDWWVGSAALQSTDDAYLHADLTPLAAKVPGYVRRVNVGDFQKVKAGACWLRSSTTITAPSWSRPRRMSLLPRRPSKSIEQQKLLQAALVEQAGATIQAAEADATRYHLEAARQQTLLLGAESSRGPVCWRPRGDASARASGRQ